MPPPDGLGLAFADLWLVLAIIPYFIYNEWKDYKLQKKAEDFAKKEKEYYDKHGVWPYSWPISVENEKYYILKPGEDKYPWEE